MSFIVLGGINLMVVPPINEDPQINNSIKPVLGAAGSLTRRTGTGGRKIDLTVRAKQSKIQEIKKLAMADTVYTLVSQSYAGYNGLYKIITYKHEEKLGDLFNITLTLQEDFQPNITYQNFKSWQVTPTTSSSSSSTTKTTGSTVASTVGTDAYCAKILKAYGGNETAALNKHRECLKYLRTHFCVRMKAKYGRTKALSKWNGICKGYI